MSYDSTYGQLIGIAYPGSLGSESFVNSAFGDVTSHTDARGFVTDFQLQQPPAIDQFGCADECDDTGHL